MHGVLLINLGTPEVLSKTAVYRYLTEFLNDPRVVDLPTPVRALLINGLVIPRRFKKTLAAYQKIWLPEGSPLLVYSQKITQALSQKLGAQYRVVLGMRYAKPSIAEALAQLKSCHTITVIPLFPQYASAATGSALAAVFAELRHWPHIPNLCVQNAFYQNTDFIAAYASLIAKTVSKNFSGHLVMSYHGLPERHLPTHCEISCDRLKPCPSTATQQDCYRAQCYATARLLAQALNLRAEQYSVAFQSRLGRTPWIKPYTDLLLPELLDRGVRDLVVVCPSFVADCLETLEEINIRAREQWLQLGGHTFTYVPCLNDQPSWIDALAKMVLRDVVE